MVFGLPWTVGVTDSLAFETSKNSMRQYSAWTSGLSDAVLTD